jgi:hypothetical protein
MMDCQKGRVGCWKVPPETPDVQKTGNRGQETGTRNDARDYIFDFTNGHPGAVSSIVYYLFKVRNRL